MEPFSMPVKIPNLKLLCAFLLASLVTYLLFFIVPQIMQLIDTSGDVPSLYWGRLTITVLVMMILFIWLSSKRFYIRFLVSFLVFFPTIIACYIGLKYDLILSPVFFADVLATNAKEASSSLISIQVLLSLSSSTHGDLEQKYEETSIKLGVW